MNKVFFLALLLISIFLVSGCVTQTETNIQGLNHSICLKNARNCGNGCSLGLFQGTAWHGQSIEFINCYNACMQKTKENIALNSYSLTSEKQYSEDIEETWQCSSQDEQPTEYPTEIKFWTPLS